LQHVLDAPFEVVLYPEIAGGSEGRPHQASSHADQRGERKQEQQPDEHTPEHAAQAAPRHRVVRRSRDMQPATAVAPDDGRILQVDQILVLEADQLAVDPLGRVFVRVSDNNQIAHGEPPSLDGVCVRLHAQRRRRETTPHLQTV
jgi:hypothetical protein